MLSQWESLIANHVVLSQGAMSTIFGVVVLALLLLLMLEIGNM
jgi:hypothetical protein